MAAVIFILVKDVVDILFDLFFWKEEVGQVKIRALYAMWCGYLQTLSSIKLMKLLKKLNIFRFSTSPASLGE